MHKCAFLRAQINYASLEHFVDRSSMTALFKKTMCHFLREKNNMRTMKRDINQQVQ